MAASQSACPRPAIPVSANTGHLAVLDRASEKVDLSHRTRLPGCAALRFVPPDHPDRSLH